MDIEKEHFSLPLFARCVVVGLFHQTSRSVVVCIRKTNVFTCHIHIYAYLYVCVCVSVFMYATPANSTTDQQQESDNNKIHAHAHGNIYACACDRVNDERLTDSVTSIDKVTVSASI